MISLRRLIVSVIKSSRLLIILRLAKGILGRVESRSFLREDRSVVWENAFGIQSHEVFSDSKQ